MLLILFSILITGNISRELVLTGAIELVWGNSVAIRSVVLQMTNREDFGAWPADGVKKAAEDTPYSVQGAAIHAGRQEIAYHDPRLDPGMALLARVAPTPLLRFME